MPKISIVMSVYNGLPYLNKAIVSILQQTFSNFEFIIIDDGSKDNTWEIITQYARNDARIIPFRNETNLGVVKGLNLGLKAARGEYIARQDADDISLPERFQKQVAFLDQNPLYGLIGSWVTYIDTQDKPINSPNPFMPIDNDEIQQKLLDNNCLCGPAVMIRRRSLEAAGFWFSEGLDASEDYDIHLRLAEVSKLAALPEPLYHYRLHQGSASNTQEYKQVVHKAMALEGAVRRRWGEAAGPEKFAVVARDYLWAMVLAFSRDDLMGASDCLARARSFYPPIIARCELLEQFICYRLPANTGEALVYLGRLFSEVIPKTRKMDQLRARLISSVHMKEVFAQASKGEKQMMKHYLWQGIRNDPRWLLNPGVLSLAIRHLI